MIINESLLDKGLESMEKARTWPSRIISKLETLIRTEEDFLLFKINPLQFAEEKNFSEQDAINLFLYATKAGLFEMSWSLLCPSCGDSVESFTSLTLVNSSFYCTLCLRETEANLDDFIQASFTISPKIREIIYHHPDSLTVEDYIFKYRFSKEARIAGGPKYTQVVQSVLKDLAYIEPEQETAFTFKVNPGGYVGVFDLLMQTRILYPVTMATSSTEQTLAITIKEREIFPAEATFKAGDIRFIVKNTEKKKAATSVIYLPPGKFEQLHNPVKFEPFLTGKKLLTTQTFRDLFRSEIIQATEGIGVKDITIWFTDLKGSTALYERIGDLKAYSLVRQHFDYLGKIISDHQGAIVKTIGDAVMAVFEDPVTAVKAALNILQQIEQFNQEKGTRDIRLKIGLHKGAVIAVTLNQRLDYFGQTVNIAARVESLANADEIYLTHDVYAFPQVQELLQRLNVVPENARLKGIKEEKAVYKVLSIPTPEHHCL